MPSVRWSRRFASSMLRQVRVQLRLRRERGPVHALELRVALVAAPVGARERQHLERLDVAGALDVRAAAEVDEVAVLEVRDLLAFRDRLDDLDLVLLAARREPLAAPRRAARRAARTAGSRRRSSSSRLRCARRPRARTARCRSRNRSRSRSTGRSRPSRSGRRRRTASAITCDAECRMRDNGSSGTSPLSRGRMVRSCFIRRAASDRDGSGPRGSWAVWAVWVGTGGIEPPTPTVSR